MRKIFDARRPLGRLFYLLMALLVAACTAHLDAQGQGPQTTQIVDTLYRADGPTAQGTVFINGQSFTTARGKAIPAGTMSVAIGSSGAFTVALAPNVGATPSGSY